MDAEQSVGGAGELKASAKTQQRADAVLRRLKLRDEARKEGSATNR